MRLIFKIQLIIFSFLLSSFLAIGQKKFEGKAVFEIIYSDKTQDSLIVENQNAAFFYKKNSVRFETADNATSIVYDYEKGDQLTLVNIPSLEYRQAVRSNIVRIDAFKIEKSEESKIIFGHKCYKVVTSTFVNKQETKATGYADFDYKIIIALDLSGNAIYSPLLFEQETVLPDGGIINQKIISLDEDFFDERLFSLDYPLDYNFLDDRKTFINEGSKSFVPDEDWNYYNKLTTVQLEAIVSTALPSEDFETATMIKDIIKKRQTGKLYRSKTINELQDLITIALNKEDFEAAEEMKTEIINRSK
jgi:hypothetical protein